MGSSGNLEIRPINLMRSFTMSNEWDAG